MTTSSFLGMLIPAFGGELLQMVHRLSVVLHGNRNMGLCKIPCLAQVAVPYPVALSGIALGILDIHLLEQVEPLQLVDVPVYRGLGRAEGGREVLYNPSSVHSLEEVIDHQLVRHAVPDVRNVCLGVVPFWEVPHLVQEKYCHLIYVAEWRQRSVADDI